MPAFSSRINATAPAFTANAAAYDSLLQTLRERLQTAAQGGGSAMVQRHRARNKIAVRDRIDLLVDPLSPFLELCPLAAWGMYGNEVPAAGLVIGVGVVHGTPCMIIANDATVKGGSFYAETVAKHIRAQEVAAENQLPCLYLVDCGGAYLPEQDRVFPGKDHFGTTFLNQCRMSASGLPQIAAVFGGCTAGGAYIPALADEMVMVRGNARIHLGGPEIVKAAIKEAVDGETLGGAEMHTLVSGVNDTLVDTEAEALLAVRDIVAKLNRPTPQSMALRTPVPPRFDPAELAGIIPADPKTPYDVHDVIARLADASDFQEFKPAWGATLVCGFAHMHGYPVGILANNGVLFAESALKGAHFIELCNQRNIPLLFLQNVTGFMVGTGAERGGISKHSAKLVYAVSTARVPRFTVIIGGSYGAGNYGMCGRGFAPRFLFAWPNARIATMSPDVAATVLTELRGRSLKLRASAAELDELAERTRRQFTEQSDPYYATARLWDDGIIEPQDTRDVIGLCLALAASSPRETGFSPVFRM